MDIGRIYIWICFFFCVALAAGGALIFFQKEGVKSIPASRYLQYYLILIYTFGFYVFWSNVFLRLFFSITAKSERLNNLPEYLALLGIPFLAAGMLMLVLWSIKLLKKPAHNLLLILISLVVFFILMIYITYKGFDLLINIHRIYALFILLVTVFAGVLLLFSEVIYLDKRTKSILILSVFLSGAIHIPVFMNLTDNPVPEMAFIFLFFLINTFTGIYYVYNVKDFNPSGDDNALLSFDLFTKKYCITARESEIIREIYNGKSNQEIADKLFVTVQTIKDHTSRIYLKTNMKNRAQLTSFLRRYE